MPSCCHCHTYIATYYVNTLNIGGDHSISIGTVLSSINKNQDTGVFWIDAHPDINTLDSSLTKRTHGKNGCVK